MISGVDDVEEEEEEVCSGGTGAHAPTCSGVKDDGAGCACAWTRRSLASLRTFFSAARLDVDALAVW